MPDADREPALKCRPSREARQQHILEATLRCVGRSGFRGASMSDIAAEAKLSVGLIYRYFASKEAIIEAIVANDIAEMRDRFSKWEDVPDDGLLDSLLGTLDQAIERRYCTNYSALGVEILAEAGRNPRVAAIVERADMQELALGRDLCRRLMPAVEPALVAARGEIIAMLFDGMMIRAISNPRVDRKALLTELRSVLRALFSVPPTAS